MLDPLRLFLITDRRRSPEPLTARVEKALSAIAPHTVAVVLREKDLETRAQVELATALLPICRRARAPLLINDRLDLALALRLDGVHLPATSFPSKEARKLLPNGAVIGASCHSADEVRSARDQGADYAFFGPIYHTDSKRAYGPPVGLDRLKDAVMLGLPLFGLGGITMDRAPAVRTAGARGIAAIAAWIEAADPALAVAALL